MIGIRRTLQPTAWRFASSKPAARLHNFYDSLTSPPAASTAVSIRLRARTAGISIRTLLRWLKIPEFAAVYRESRRQAFGQSIARLQQATSAVAATLMKIMVDAGAPASVRVRAADRIFNHSARAFEIEDIEAAFQNWNGPRKLQSRIVRGEYTQPSRPVETS